MTEIKCKTAVLIDENATFSYIEDCLAWFEIRTGLRPDKIVMTQSAYDEFNAQPCGIYGWSRPGSRKVTKSYFNGLEIVVTND